VGAAYLDEQRRMLPESSFQRLHMNEWCASEDRLTSIEDLRACVLLEGPLEPQPNTRYVVGVDLGLKRDRTVCAICHAERDREGVRVLLDRMEVWEGSRFRPVDLGGVETWLAQQAARYNHANIVIDPYQAIGLAQRLRRGGLVIEEFTFSQQSVGQLAIALHTAIRDHRIVLPDDSELIVELSNVRLRETSTPGVLRMDHDSGRHDDRAIALALSVQRLIQSGFEISPYRPQRYSVGLLNDPRSAEEFLAARGQRSRRAAPPGEPAAGGASEWNEAQRRAQSGRPGSIMNEQF
jgi:phage FluMu gp28-like protein